MNDCQTYLLEIAKGEQNPAYRPSVSLEPILSASSDSHPMFTMAFLGFPILAAN